MAERNNPTNQQIFTAIGQLTEKVEQIHEQTLKTNGRVTKLEINENNRSYREEYQEKQGVKTPTEVKEGWTAREKTLTAMITALLAIVTALVGAGKL